MAWRASSPSSPRSPSPTRKAPRCATAASTSRTSSGACPFENVWGLLIDGAYTPGLAPGRALQPPGAHRRRARRRAGRGGHARAGLRLRPDLRHLRRAGPRRHRPPRGHGALLRRAVGPRPQPGRRPAEGRRRGQDAGREVPHPLEGRGRPQARQGDRRLLEQRGRARHERLHLHRPRHHLHRGRRGRRLLRRHRRDERPAARRGPGPRARHDRGRREVRRRRPPTSRDSSTPASG